MTAVETPRQPYFYTHGTAVLCNACAREVLERDDMMPDRMLAQYTASREYRCGSCLVSIGPVNAEEAGRA